MSDAPLASRSRARVAGRPARAAGWGRQSRRTRHSRSSRARCTCRRARGPSISCIPGSHQTRSRCSRAEPCCRGQGNAGALCIGRPSSAIPQAPSGCPRTPGLLAIDGVGHADVGERIQQAIDVATDAGRVDAVDLHATPVNGAVGVVANGAGPKAALGAGDCQGLASARHGPEVVYGLSTALRRLYWGWGRNWDWTWGRRG
jgi:hypothetical protein